MYHAVTGGPNETWRSIKLKIEVLSRHNNCKMTLFETIKCTGPGRSFDDFEVTEPMKKKCFNLLIQNVKGISE